MSASRIRKFIGLFEAYPRTSSILATVLGTAAYVNYRDYRRVPRMMETFAQGNIMEPLREVPHQCRCFIRTEALDEVREVLTSGFANQYYVITGEVGVGKTRIVTEVINEMMSGSGAERQGAPVYVLASQGSQFVDSLAKAVNFSFDEHISIKYLSQFLMNIDTLPKKSDSTKLDRLLNAIETASYRYTREQGKPVVLVIDGVNWLADNSQGVLEKIQEKAKLWADTNIVKVVFVSSYGKGQGLLQKNDNAWSRAAAPVIIEDLTDKEAVQFLMESKHCCEAGSHDESGDSHVTMSPEHAHKIVNLVGGRIHLLLACRLDWEHGVPFYLTARRYKQKERTKLVIALKDPVLRKAASMLHKTDKKTMPLEEFLSKTGKDIVVTLDDLNVISFENKRGRTLVKFYSRLTEHVVEEL